MEIKRVCFLRFVRLAPSLVAETSSLVAIEALAPGTPVVAFPNGALSEIIKPRKSGFLVNNVAEMAQAIHSCEAISPVDCRREAALGFNLSQWWKNILRFTGA